MKILIMILLLLSFAIRAEAKEFSCKLQDHNGNVLFEETEEMVDDRGYFILLQDGDVVIRALALMELVVIESVIRDVQSRSLAHLSAGSYISDNTNELWYYALCTIKL